LPSRAAVAALFIPALALAAGIWTGGGKLFEVFAIATLILLACAMLGRWRAFEGRA